MKREEGKLGRRKERKREGCLVGEKERGKREEGIKTRREIVTKER